MKLKKLLKSLIERGWKPWGLQFISSCHIVGKTVIFEKKNSHGTVFGTTKDSLRELVGLESGLRQFLIEKRIVSDRQFPGLLIDRVGMGSFHYEHIRGAEYWIMRASIQEDVESFILENVDISD